MKLFSAPLSLFARKIEIALAEKGLDYERVMVPFTQEQGYHPKHPEVQKHNPKAQVPVLLDGDLTLFDSSLIFEYLEEAYSSPALFPADPANRARCRLLELTADEIILPKVVKLMYRTEPPHEDPAVQARRVEGGAKAEQALLADYRELEEKLGARPYFLETFSVADIALFMVLLFTFRLKGPALDPNSHLGGWYARCLARPAMRRVADEIAEADRQLSPA